MHEVTGAEKIRRLPWEIANSALKAFFYTATFGSLVFVLLLSKLRFPRPLIGLRLLAFPCAAFFVYRTLKFAPGALPRRAPLAKAWRLFRVA